MITLRASLNRDGITLINPKGRGRVFFGWGPQDLSRPVAYRMTHPQWRAAAEILSPAEDPKVFEVVHAVTREVLYRSPVL